LAYSLGLDNAVCLTSIYIKERTKIKPKSKIDSRLANLKTEARPRLGFRDRGETFQKSNLRLLWGKTAVSRTTSLVRMKCVVSGWDGTNVTPAHHLTSRGWTELMLISLTPKRCKDEASMRVPIREVNPDVRGTYHSGHLFLWSGEVCEWSVVLPAQYLASQKSEISCVIVFITT